MKLRNRLVDCLHLFVLSGFALAQPLFDLLSRFPEFFSARESQPADIVVLGLVLLIVIPALLAVVEIVSGLFGETAGTGAHRFIVGALAVLIAMPVLKKIPGIPDPVTFAGAGLVGAGFVVLYVRYSVTRQFVSVLSVTLVLFPALFIFNSPVQRLVFPDRGSSHAGVVTGATPPIVMVILDELPVTSLMDESRNIDPVRYPNFSALAGDSYWYRNATTVAGGTLTAIPAILTGALPVKEKRLPIAEDYPGTLFSFLASSYEMNVFESVTRLCPERWCPRETSRLGERLKPLLTDIVIVYFHLVLPRDAASRLPDITENWGSFLVSGEPVVGNDHESEKPPKRFVGTWQKKAENPQFFGKFSNSLQFGDRPLLNFMHVVLPHVPFKYLPSGKTYNYGLWPGKDGDGTEKNRWVDEWAAAQHYLQSLLQLAYVDKLLGELLERLKRTGLYDEALIVVVSDHGASYKPGDNRRLLSEGNYMNIMPILMLLKVPGQQEGVVSDRNVETIDILPTIASILHTELPFQVDGQSMLDGSIPERSKKTFYWKRKKAFVHFGRAMDEKYGTLQYKIDLLGVGSAPVTLYGLGLPSELVGKRLEEAELGENAEVKIEVDNLEQYGDVDLSGEFLPARITGRVHSLSKSGASFDIAISVNGVIGAVARTYPREGGNEFFAMIPETAFRSGRNDVRVFVVPDATE